MFCSVYFQEVIGIIQLLDPEGKGKVSFTDFCQGVQQILEVQGDVSFSFSVVLYGFKQFIDFGEHLGVTFVLLKPK